MTSSKTTWPADIDRNSGMRLPIPDRATLDADGQAAFDRAAKPGNSIAGLQGPGGIRLYSTQTAAMLSGVNKYLRYDAGLSGRVREIAILITAREMDSQFEWVAHEGVALKEGVPAAVIDAIKHRRSTAALEPADALIVELGRQLWRDHKVTPATFKAANELFGSGKLVELVTLMGSYAATAALLHLVDMQLHEGDGPLLPVP